MTAENTIHIELLQRADYRFEARFDASTIPPLLTDEGPPVGTGQGPSPAQLLGTAVANCLAASLLFAMRKYRNEPGPLRAVAQVREGRNEHKRLRILAIDVDLHLGVPASQIQSLDRILAQFEDFCVVTQSVRAAIPVGVRVIDGDAQVLAVPQAA